MTRASLLLLSLALDACTGQAESDRFASADAAVEAGQTALQRDEFERAADAFAQARELAPDSVQATQFALDQCRALIGGAAEGEALALLIDLADQDAPFLRPESLGDLARSCTQRGKLCSSRLAELCLQIAHEVFDEQELARMDPEGIALALVELGTIDLGGLEKLGYVERERNPPVSKPPTLPTMKP
jgi:hypothetical protein